jgi:hypothetical protein
MEIFIKRKDIEVLEKYIVFMKQQTDDRGFKFKGTLSNEFIDAVKHLYAEVTKLN